MNTELASINRMIVHLVGSKNNLDPIVISQEAPKLEEEQSVLLSQAFLGRFKSNKEYHAFHHPDSLDFNQVYTYAKRIFNDREQFLETSAQIARHLYDQSTHPRVKGGELYIVLFEALPVEGHNHQALGIFKAEHKSTYLDSVTKKASIALDLREGVEINEMDKGCLIIDAKRDEGFDVLIFDNQNKGDEAQYWKEKFLGVTPQQNEFHHTSHFLTLTKQFITGPLETDLKIPRTEQVELLNRSLDYFKSNESFEIGEFQKQVFANEEMIDSFRKFGSQYVQNTDYDIAGSFGISTDAVKKQSRIFKSVLKLDRNFHIYIHGRTDLIEKGTDLDGRKYYKIYYQEES